MSTMMLMTVSSIPLHQGLVKMTKLKCYRLIPVLNVTGVSWIERSGELETINTSWSSVVENNPVAVTGSEWISFFKKMCCPGKV